MPDTTQIERQLYILSLISESRAGFTIDEIMDYLSKVGIDNSKRTIERDIDYISTVNFPVMEEIRDNKTYYIASKFGLKNINFTITELISLYFIREVIATYSTLDIGTTAKQLIERLITRLPRLDRAYIETLKDFLKVELSNISAENNLNIERLNIIRKAVETKRRVLVKYYSYNSDETTERKFDPYFLQIFEGCYHIIGYCHLRKEIRDLRVSRILEIQILDEYFERPDNAYEDYKKKMFLRLIGKNRINLELKFTGNAARFIIEYEANRADKLLCQEDGSVLFIKETTDAPEIIKWILGFGSEVQVNKPEHIKQRVKEEIRKMNSLYSD